MNLQKFLSAKKTTSGRPTATISNQDYQVHNSQASLFAAVPGQNPGRLNRGATESIGNVVSRVVMQE